MTYAITPGTKKALQAKEWGQEMLRACRARDITLNELGRSVGHGHTAIDHYRKGDILPRTETAYAIADVLNWPRLKTLIDAARVSQCARCGKDFRNDGGGAKRYCTAACRQIAENLRVAQRRRRSAGQTDSKRQRSAADRRMKAIIAILQGELAVMHEHVARMCRSCEPEGTCRTFDCPLRPVSPLPFHEHVAEATPEHVLRTERRWTPAHRESHREAMRARWAKPGAREAQAARSKAWHDGATAERREAWIEQIRQSKAARM